jgi:mannose-6-phosphate isomerase-like protein (cupin superfamily)
MMPATINFAEKLARIDAPWSPRVVAELNDYQFKLVKIHGEFVWHRHEDTDEAFLVQQGELHIDFRDGTVTLRAGEMTVVPRGVEHRPHADAECHVLLIEPRGVVNTGDAGGPRTAPNDVWI